MNRFFTIILLLTCVTFSFGQITIEDVELDEIIINAKLKLPDLYIHELSGIDSIVKKGTRMAPKIAIGNKGNASAGKKKWSYFFYIEDKLVTFNRVAPFDLIGGKIISFPSDYDKNKKYGSYLFKKAGRYHYKLVIETKRKFKEFDKENNSIEGFITVVD